MLNKKQSEFVQDMPVYSLCRLIDEIYYQELDKANKKKPTSLFKLAKKLGLTDDNGVSLAIELVSRCKYSSF